jgi:hypothetical protein
MLAILILFITEVVTCGESWDQQWLGIVTAWLKSWIALDHAQIVYELCTGCNNWKGSLWCAILHYLLYTSLPLCILSHDALIGWKYNL